MRKNPNDWLGDLLVRTYGPLYTLLALAVLGNFGVNFYSQSGSPWTNAFVLFVILGFAFMDAPENATRWKEAETFNIPGFFVKPLAIAISIFVGAVKGIFHGSAAIIAAGIFGIGFPVLLPEALKILLVFAANGVLMFYSGWLIYQKWPGSVLRHKDWQEALYASPRRPNQFARSKYGITGRFLEFLTLVVSLVAAGWLAGVPVFVLDASHILLWGIIVFAGQFLTLGGLWLRSTTNLVLLRTILVQVAVGAFYGLASLSLATTGEAISAASSTIWFVFTISGIGLISYIEAHYLRLWKAQDRTE